MYGTPCRSQVCRMPFSICSAFRKAGIDPWILLYLDSYDVMTRTKDNINVDESEEVYNYFL